MPVSGLKLASLTGRVQEFTKDENRMPWALLLGLLAIAMIMAMHSRGQVPWLDKMRRVKSSGARKPEWMAPDDVVDKVRSDYLTATRWLSDNVLSSWQQQWMLAPYYMSGLYLKRFQTLVTQYRAGRMPRAVGVLRADHQVSVRAFTEDGERCVVVDRQSLRRMATYDSRTHERVMTQDLGDGVVVYQMRYDAADGRWKLDEFVQELPDGWGKPALRARIRELSPQLTPVGRDN
jgi:hypothetical protein